MKILDCILQEHLYIYNKRLKILKILTFGTIKKYVEEREYLSLIEFIFVNVKREAGIMSRIKK